MRGCGGWRVASGVGRGWAVPRWHCTVRESDMERESLKICSQLTALGTSLTEWIGTKRHINELFCHQRHAF